MNTLLILFFISLASISLMLGRKVMLVRDGYIVVEESTPHPFIPDIHKVKNFVVSMLKKLVYILTFLTLKVYVKFTNFIKKQYNEIKTRIKNRNQKKQYDGMSAKPEGNKFLQAMVEYKKKISAMKHSIDQVEKSQ